MKKKTYYSVIHKNCGGEITIVAHDRTDVMPACRRCETSWTYELPFGILKANAILADEMEIGKP